MALSLQALLLSLLPADVAVHLRPEPGQQLSALAPVMDWFRATFKLAAAGGGSTESRGGEQPSEDELTAAQRRAKGLDGVLDLLQEVCVGTAESTWGPAWDDRLVELAALGSSGSSGPTLKTMYYARPGCHVLRWSAAPTPASQPPVGFDACQHGCHSCRPWSVVAAPGRSWWLCLWRCFGHMALRHAPCDLCSPSPSTPQVGCPVVTL